MKILAEIEVEIEAPSLDAADAAINSWAGSAQAALALQTGTEPVVTVAAITPRRV